jgi:glutathione S-transferase
MATLLYGVAGSPYVRAARLALEEKGVAYEFVLINPGSLKDPENLARHPFGRMPSFEHDGFKLYEAQAIMRYVDQAFPGPALQPAEPRRAARMNQLIGIVDWYLFACASASITFERLVAPRVFGRPSDEARIAAAVPQAKHCLGAIEDLMAEGPYVTGATLTLADLHLYPHIEYLNYTAEGRSVLEPHARLCAWLARMGTDPAVARAVPKAA